MSDYQPIDCALYEYLEIACMQRYTLRIRATGGRILIGTASDTLTTAEKIEYLLLEVGGTTQHLRLDEIVQIEPLSPGSRFGVIRFRNAAGGNR